MTQAKNKYQREIKKGVVIDVYDVLKAFNVSNPATAHAIKKLLMPGERGHKSFAEDMREATQAINRAIELEATDEYFDILSKHVYRALKQDGVEA